MLPRNNLHPMHAALERFLGAMPHNRISRKCEDSCDICPVSLFHNLCGRAAECTIADLSARHLQWNGSEVSVRLMSWS